MEFIRAKGAVGQGWTMFELVNSAFALSRELAKTKPSKRGRRSDVEQFDHASIRAFEPLIEV